MGALAAGLVLGPVLLIIGLAIALLVFIVGLFSKNVIVFDSIAIGILAFVLAQSLLSLHTLFCILIAIAAFGLLMLLQLTKVGFWIVGVLMSLVWSVAIGAIFMIFSNGDKIWTIGGLIIGFIITLLLHIKSHRKMRDEIGIVSHSRRKKDDNFNMSDVDFCDVDTGKHYAFVDGQLVPRLDPTVNNTPQPAPSPNGQNGQGYVYLSVDEYEKLRQNQSAQSAQITSAAPNTQQ